jgi:hypothetical protein
MMPARPEILGKIGAPACGRVKDEAFGFAASRRAKRALDAVARRSKLATKI